jgi:hypothetical protein|tara:strand:- start:28 stop:438 length:411 start_codon:yes stop_codon:yes gene_type:complete
MFKKTAGKFVYEMLVPKIKKSLPERRKHFEDVVKGTDKYTKNLTKEGQITVKKNVAPTVKKISKIMDQKDKLGPGSSNPKRVSRKFGGGADMGSKKLSAKQMKIASLAGNKKKIDKADFKKLRAMKSPMDKQVRKA